MGRPSETAPGGLILYAVPVSSYCAKTRILLRHKRQSWTELPPPGGYGSAEYKSIVPTGNLPAIIHDGLQLADSEAIAEYLEERFPQPAALPADIRGRAKARERSRFHDTRLEPALRALYPHIGAEPRDEHQRSKAISNLRAQIEQFGRMLERDGEMCPAALTLGDCGYPIAFAWIDRISDVLGFAVAWPDSVTAYRTAVERFDAIAAELTAYEPHMRAWLDSKLNPS